MRREYVIARLVFFRNSYMLSREIRLLVLLVLSIGVPFLNKPFHIDDTFFLHITRSILNTPLNPFVGEINWFGSNRPVWEVTTNPPFLSYYLTPFAVLSNYSEVALHASMLLFLLMMAGAIYYLATRFAPSTWFPVMFVMSSAAIVVSSNAMQDIPAAGLAAAGIAFYIAGTDRDNRGMLLLGSFLVALAMMTKYWAIITLPVFALYSFFQRKSRYTLWILLPLSFLFLWCLHNFIFYDSIHIVYLTLQRGDLAVWITWQDKLCGALVILGSILYLVPSILWRGYISKNVLLLGILMVIILGSWWGVQTHFQGSADGEYLFWSIGGAILLTICIYDGIGRGLFPYLKDRDNREAADSLFLFLWFCGPLLFSILLVPSQAVRHLILALPPMTLLSFRYLQLQSQSNVRFQNILLITMLCIQSVLSILVQSADYEYANTYRQFAEEAKQKWVSSEHQTWYVGHWGWQFYANRAGFRQIHAGEEMPKKGDIILQPFIATHDMHDVFKGNEDILKGLSLLEEKKYDGVIPIKTMNLKGAGFYAITDARGTPIIPYRLFQDLSLETFHVFRVGELTAPK